MNTHRSYERPEIRTLEAREILEMIGPAQGSSSGAPTANMPFLEERAGGGSGPSRFGR